MNAMIHIGNLLMYSFAVYYVFFVLHIPMLSIAFKKFDPGQFKYLTMWNVILQAIFFLICLLNDRFGTNAVNPKKPPFIRRLKDYVHAAFSFPVAMFVGITFWSLMFVDRELVMPRALDPYFPWWLNHLLHTAIMVSTILEMITNPRKYPSRSNGIGGLAIFMLAYLTWMHVIYYKSGVWVYPVMDVLTLPLRIAFFIALLVFSIILYIVGETLDSMLWGNQYSKHQKSHSKSK